MAILEIQAPEPMDDTELLSIIDRERNAAHGYHDELSEQRRKALYYYQGEAKEDLAPPEVDGRSAVVSKDVMEAVEWAIPSLVRIFTSSDDVVSFVPTKPGQEQQCTQATKYCNWVLNSDSRNNGFIVYHDAIKNSLIQRMAWVKVYYEQVWDERQERYSGLSPAELAMLQQDPDVQVISIVQEQEAVIGPDGMMVSPPMVSVTVIRREDASYCKVVGVPPEEVFVSRDCRDIEDVRFICHERKMTASDLVSLGVPQDIIDSLGEDEGGETGEENERDRAASKWGAEDDDGADESQREITVVEAYIKVDYDRDGVSEWRCVKKSGSTILSNDVVDDHPFALASPILMPYQLVGLSMYDLLADLQRIKTTLQRQMLDNVYLQNNGRVEVETGQVNLDDLLNPRPGGMIRVKRLGAIREITPPNLIGNSLESLSFFDSVRQRRSGVTEMGSGLSPEAVNKTQAGVTVDLLQQAARERIELIARVYAETFVKRMYKLILKCATQYQKGAKQILVTGGFMEVNPREWATNYNMQVAVGLGAQSKQAQVQGYMQLMQLQQQLMGMGLVKPEQIGTAAIKLVEALGHKDAGKYVLDPATVPPGTIQPPPPPQDPNAALAQAQIQSEQIKSQTAQQKAMLDAEIEKQKLINENQQAQLDADVSIAVARIRAETDIAIAAAKNQTERDIAGSELTLKYQQSVAPAVSADQAVQSVVSMTGQMQQQLAAFTDAVGRLSQSKRKRVSFERGPDGRPTGAVIEE